METVGMRIRRIREARGLSQAALGEKAKMERTDISRAESGKLRLGQDRLGRVADALQVTVLELDERAEPDERASTLADRLEELATELAENQAQGLKNQKAALRGQQQILDALEALRVALGIPDEAARTAPKQKRDRR